MRDRRSGGQARASQPRASAEGTSRPAKRRADGRAAPKSAAAPKPAAAARSGKQRSEGRASRSAARAVQRAKRSPGEGTTRRLMRIRELDPQTTCGRGTTVLQLYRVDDLPTDAATTHLVFYDRHGWYCEHGRECPAVAAVRKHEKRNILTRKGWMRR